MSSTVIPSMDVAPRPAAPPEVWDGPEVVLVHDWIGGVHGAEQVLRELATLFPKAPILTLFSDTRVLPALGIDPARVRQSYLGRVPNAVRLRKVLLPWFADAVQTLDVGDAALVVSSSHAVAKNVPCRSYQRHISYIHAPLRYAHDLMQQYLRGVPAVIRPLVRSRLRELATWDVVNANQVSRFVANSRVVAQRIWRIYRRPAAVLHPPVDVDAIPLGSGPRGDYYVTLSRLEVYKRLDLAIRAAVLANRRLVLVGQGPERRRLESLVGSLGGSKLVEFTGWVSDRVKHELVAGSRGLLFPGEEDFGIVGVEALATGVPVVALGRGGMLDVVGARHSALLGGGRLVEPGGVLVGEQTAEALADGITTLEAGASRERSEYRALALRFATPAFRRRFLELARRVAARS
jgi:glycosyltransferase involved in cell wall biosynthesis